MTHPHRTPPSDPARDAHRARVERHMAGLKELAELGLELAKALALRGIEAARAGDDKAEEIERSYSRATRAVRLTMALEARLSESLLVKDKPGKDPEDGFWMPYAQIESAQERLREKLGRLVADRGEEDAGSEDEDGEATEAAEPSEREARERLVETEGDFDPLTGVSIVNSFARAAAVAGPLHRPSGGPPPPMGEDCSRPPGQGSYPPQSGRGMRFGPRREPRFFSVQPCPPSHIQWSQSGEEDERPEGGGGGSPRAEPYPVWPKPSG